MRVVCAAILCFWAVSASAAEMGPRPVRILPLGDSITDGDGQHDSYRRPLWHLLRDAGIQVDFIGSKKLNGYHDEDPPHPDFDQDHEGHTGWTARDIITGPAGWDKQRGNLREWLGMQGPDIVLLHVGTNDVFKCTPIDDIIEAIRDVTTVILELSPQTAVVLAKVVPIGDARQLGFDDRYCGGGRTLGQIAEELNGAIGSLAGTTRVVDVHSAIDPHLDLYDGIHPNASGERKIAEVWYKAIQDLVSRTTAVDRSP
jgi:acyl-CoA thioesterase I